MSNEKTIEYDYGSSISFVSSIETICGLMGGFVFSGIIVILTTLEDPSILLSQIALFILSQAMGMFTMAIWELHYLNILVCAKSPQPIIPNYPARWRIINTYITAGSFLEMISIQLMFLLKDLTILFVLSSCSSVFGFIMMFHKRRKLVKTRSNEKT